MDKPTIAEERYARLIAMWHGQKIVYHSRSAGNVTVAAMRGFNSGWARELDRYVESHWQEYIPAAKAIIEMNNG